MSDVHCLQVFTELPPRMGDNLYFKGTKTNDTKNAGGGIKQRIHPSSLKLTIEGPHTDQTNPGFSRKIDGTLYSIWTKKKKKSVFTFLKSIFITSFEDVDFGKEKNTIKLESWNTVKSRFSERYNYINFFLPSGNLCPTFCTWILLQIHLTSLIQIYPIKPWLIDNFKRIIEGVRAESV